MLLLFLLASSAGADEAAIRQSMGNINKQVRDQLGDVLGSAQQDTVRKGLGLMMFYGALLNYEKLKTFEFFLASEPELVEALFRATQEVIHADPKREPIVEDEAYAIHHMKHLLECDRERCKLRIRDNPSHLGRRHPSQKLTRDLYEGMLFLEALESPLVQRVPFDPTENPKHYGLNVFSARKYQAEHYFAIGKPGGRQILCGRLSRYRYAPRHACFYFLEQ